MTQQFLNIYFTIKKSRLINIALDTKYFWEKLEYLTSGHFHCTLFFYNG